MASGQWCASSAAYCSYPAPFLAKRSLFSESIPLLGHIELQEKFSLEVTQRKHVRPEPGHRGDHPSDRDL